MNDLSEKSLKEDEYVLTGHELVEFENIHDWEVFRYLVYRYKYNMYPLLKIFDDYPPSVQIEIASVCNFRCVFCYQSDSSFSSEAPPATSTPPTVKLPDIDNDPLIWSSLVRKSPPIRGPMVGLSHSPKH